MTVTVAIPSWNTREYLLALLQPLIGESSLNIVVVDNASDDGTAEAVARTFPEVTLLQHEQNRGFAGAVNRAIRWAAAHTPEAPLVLLNPDTRCTPAALLYLAHQLEADPAIAAIAPALKLPGGANQPYAFGDDPDIRYLLRRGWHRLVHRQALHDWSIQEPIIVDWVSFACVCMRASVLREVGGLDEHFFMYFEDNDWCKRARSMGWTVRYDPGASIVHIGGASLSQNPSAAKAYRQSLRLFYRKHFSRWQRMLLALLLPVYARLASRGCV